MFNVSGGTANDKYNPSNLLILQMISYQKPKTTISLISINFQVYGKIKKTLVASQTNEIIEHSKTSQNATVN